jgi:transcriptional regulator with XRE-family HTH domain
MSEMDRTQARRLGQFLKLRRTKIGNSLQQVGSSCGLSPATILRLERGDIQNPDPQKLRVLANTLALDPAEVLALAGQAVPTDLLTPSAYLRTKYRDLPPEQLQQLQEDVNRVLARHGLVGGRWRPDPDAVRGHEAQK